MSNPVPEQRGRSRDPRRARRERAPWLGGSGTGAGAAAGARRARPDGARGRLGRPSLRRNGWGAGAEKQLAIALPRPHTEWDVNWSAKTAQVPRATCRRDRLYRWALCAADMVSAASVVIVATAIGRDSWAYLATAALPLVVIVSKVLGLYDRDAGRLHKSTLDELPTLLQVAALYSLCTWILSGLFVSEVPHRPEILALWFGLSAEMPIARALARWAVGRLTPVERCLLIGDPAVAARLRAKFTAGRIRAELVARIDPGEITISPTESWTNGRDRLRALIHERGIERVIVAHRDAEGEAMLDLMRASQGLGVKVTVLPRILEVAGSSVIVDSIHGMTVLGLQSFRLTRSSYLVKRALDVVCASLALVLLAPLFAVLAVLLRLDSPGPVLFRQTRIGRGGVPFEMFKFRTMVDGAEAQKPGLRELNEAQGLFKIAEDPRITRIGRPLRRSSLDELPQLWNVVRGEMSLVGPRPLVVDEDRLVVGWHRRRLHLTPGMTGHWQVLGSARIPLEEMVAIDYLYVANWSLWNDVKILLRTLPVVLGRRGM
ncbi:MAG TPA: sugar transferase [Solirubrobacteraceae bacterium]|nr:sugar transferase [Solirubrobacteraceae bacterium]